MQVVQLPKELFRRSRHGNSTPDLSREAQSIRKLTVRRSAWQTLGTVRVCLYRQKTKGFGCCLERNNKESEGMKPGVRADLVAANLTASRSPIKIM